MFILSDNYITYIQTSISEPFTHPYAKTLLMALRHQDLTYHHQFSQLDHIPPGGQGYGLTRALLAGLARSEDM